MHIVIPAQAGIQLIYSTVLPPARERQNQTCPARVGVPTLSDY